MGNASSTEMVRRCVGLEIAPPVVKSLAGATQHVFEAIEARTKAMNLPPGLDAVHVAQALGEGRGSQADLVVAIMETKGIGRIDLYEMLAVLTMYGKIPARLKVKNLFDLFDLDLDGKLNSSETIVMLRSLLHGIAKSTGGVLPNISDIEAIWQHIVRLGYTDEEGRLPFARWINFCSKTREVHALGKSLDFNKGVCRKSLTSGTRATLSAMVLGEDDAVMAAQRAALTKKPQERASVAVEKKRAAAAAREGRNRFARSSIMKIKEVFDSIDKDGSGYVDEEEWRRLTEDTPLAASDDTFLFIEREREGKISIVEVLCEVHPFAGDADLAKMLEWISEETTQQGVARIVNRELAVAERLEMAELFSIYDAEGNGEMPLSELATAMGDIVGLTKEDVMPMFSQSGRTEEDYITASDFADTLMEFVNSDSSIQSLIYAI
ncbi:unnamed protein product [Ectocarpus sp. 12 AP-2014]